MTYNDVLEQARGQMGPCKACPVCDGRGCRGTIPGPGAKGVGDTAIRGCRFLPALSGLYSCITAANTMTLPTTISSYRLAGTPGFWPLPVMVPTRPSWKPPAAL